MTPRTLKLLERCIEDGIELGWNRAHKHDNNPSFEFIKDQMLINISNEIHEWFDFTQGEVSE